MNNPNRIWPPPPIRPYHIPKTFIPRDTLTPFPMLDIGLGILAGLVFVTFLTCLFFGGIQAYLFVSGRSGYNAMYWIPAEAYYSFWCCVPLLSLALYFLLRRRFAKLSSAYFVTAVLALLLSANVAYFGHMQLR